MKGAVLALCDGSRTAASQAAAAFALQLARDTGTRAQLAFIGAPDWPDHGWAKAWKVEAADGRGAARAVTSLIEDNAFGAVVAPDSPLCREIAGRLAGRLGLPLGARVLSAAVVGDDLEVVRVVEGGKRSAAYRLATLPALLLVDQDASVPALSGPSGRAEAQTIVADTTQAIELIGERHLQPLEIAPQEADVVVSGGRGLGKEGFALAEELASLLHGAVGASRVAADLGWAPRSCQVGMTGHVVQPRLYIAAGIAGAIHHTFGMKDSGFIVAINSDQGAPIFKFADAAIVADARELLAALIEEIRRRRAAKTPRPGLVSSVA